MEMRVTEARLMQLNPIAELPEPGAAEKGGCK
jgi:hypothetical protein